MPSMIEQNLVVEECVLPEKKVHPSGAEMMLFIGVPAMEGSLPSITNTF